MTVPAGATHRPTGRALAALFVAIGLANLAVVSGSPWFLLLAGALTGLMLAAWRPGPA